MLFAYQSDWGNEFYTFLLWLRSMEKCFLQLRVTGGTSSIPSSFGSDQWKKSYLQFFKRKMKLIRSCIKFLESYYLILVTKRHQIGCICGHSIYGIDENQLIAIPHVSIQSDVAHSKTELRYKKLPSSVDFTKDFFYSYTYPIMQSLQRNVLHTGEEGMPYNNIFVWNSYLTQAIRLKCNNTFWTIALVHGHFKQFIKYLGSSFFCLKNVEDHPEVFISILLCDDRLGCQFLGEISVFL
ncbi:hypothetical protein SLEP1_g57874 [Rubroshorea leprosula]|uniref:SAC domain-containing protein n=1 Tax=Rubroshorea leprosula TaxID=152421 RepID=A0AAV5MQD0_9ROSI|nr:hypothetical protein SLEP1_g57874 [Rubroshorea leprosula]